MNCNLNKKRTINNLFSILTCNTCNNEFSYSYTYIGNNVIHLYKINNKCINKYKKFKIMKLFLKENILNNNDIFLILSIKEYINISDILPLFINNCNVFVLII